MDGGPAKSAARRCAVHAAAVPRRSVPGRRRAGERAARVGREDALERAPRATLRRASGRAIHPARPRTQRDAGLAARGVSHGRNSRHGRRHARAIRAALAGTRSPKLAATGRALPGRALRRSHRGPGGEMERVRAFISIAPSPSLAVPTVCGQEVPSNSSFERSAPGVVLRQSRATVLSTADAKLVRAITAQAARHCGYRVAPLSALARSAIALRLLPHRAVAAVASRMRRRPPPRRWSAVAFSVASTQHRLSAQEATERVDTFGGVLPATQLRGRKFGQAAHELVPVRLIRGIGLARREPGKKVLAVERP